MATSKSYAIPKLNGSNYLNWASDLKYLLIERGLWDILNEEKPAPEKITPEYKSRANVCLSIIYLNIESEYRKIIENCNEDPKIAWQVLKQNFCPDSRASHMRLYTELMECRIRPRENIILYASRLLRISNQILDINPKYDTIYTCFQLLRYLPTQFDSIVQSILRWKDTDFDFSKIVEELVAEEVRLKVRDQDRGRTAAELEMVSLRRKMVKCWKCGKPGHVISQCKSGNYENQNKPGTNFKSYGNKTKGQQMNRNERSGDFGRRPQFKKGGASAFFISEASLTESLNSNSWLFDTGASHHFSCDRNLFIEFEPLKNENLVVAVKDLKFPIEGKGVIELQFGNRIFKFTDVMYSSQLRRNLISGPRMDQKGAKFIGGNRQVKIFRDNAFQFRAYLRKGIYRLYPKIPKHNQNKKQLLEVSSINKSEDDFKLWHRRLGHISAPIMLNTSKHDCVRGLPDFKGKWLDCDLCKISKFKRISFKPTFSIRSKAPLELLFADVWGPCQVEGRNGEKYFLSIIDDFSRKVAIYPIRMKSDVPDILVRHITRAENQLDKRVKCIRTDNGGEFKNDFMADFFSKKGIKHEFTNPYSPEQNGVVERYNQTLADGMCTLLEDSGLDISFWPEAATFFAHAWNRICPKKLTKTPLELYTGKAPSVNHLKTFGCVVFIGIPRQRRYKLNLKATKGIMVGYAFKTKGYRVWIPGENKIIETTNCSFKENQKYIDLKQSENDSGAVLGTIDYGNLRFTDNDNLPSVPTESQPIESTQDIPETSELPESDSPIPDEVIWERKPKLRNDKSRTDVYYYEKDKNVRLRSHNNVKEYCNKNNITYNPQIFNFNSNDNYTGLITNSGVKLDEPAANLTQS